MDWSDASALADLQMHWDEAYVIGLDGDIWSARYHTSTDELRAHTSSELRELIRSDYTYRQKVDLASRDPGEDADEEVAEGQDEDEDGLADGSIGAGETWTATETETETGDPSTDAGENDAGETGAGETEIETKTKTGAEAGDASAATGEDAASAARRTAADVNFAAIRGERMST
jgi:hypothetical protein